MRRTLAALALAAEVAWPVQLPRAPLTRYDLGPGLWHVRAHNAELGSFRWTLELKPGGTAAVCRGLVRGDDFMPDYRGTWRHAGNRPRVTLEVAGADFTWEFGVDADGAPRTLTEGGDVYRVGVRRVADDR
jgi:hypothetical protein